MYIKKLNISFIFLTLTNLAYFFFSSVSGYRPITIILKSILGILLLFAFIADYKISKVKIDIRYQFSANYLLNLKKNNHELFAAIFLSLSIFVLAVVSVIWSPAKSYGLFKTLNLFLNTIFITLINIYYIKRLTLQNLRLLHIISISLALLTLIVAFVLNPFNYDSSQSISLNRWSHIQYSSFLALIFFISIYSYHKSKGTISSKSFFRMIYLLLYSLILIGIYYSALRSSIIGMFLASVMLVSYSIIKRKSISVILTLTFLVLLPVTLIIFKPFGDNKAAVRYGNILQFEDLKFNNDGPIQSRISAYKESQEISIKNLPFGTGFGGYKTQSRLAYYLNYPHNIFLETIIELGIPGTILLLLLFYFLIKATIKISPILTAMFVYALTLAFFSKDIPNQSFLFLIIAIIISSNKSSQ